MQAHLVQFDIQWESPEANYAAVTGMLEDADLAPGDLVVLPELFDSGFSLNTAQTRDDHRRTLSFLADTAKRHQIMIQGGRTIVAPGATHAHNVMSVIGPDGVTRCEYAKIHPFSFGRESEAFVGGDEVVTFAWGENDPLVCCPAICYDLRFPELFRVSIARGAELFSIGANWPDTRQEHWRTLLLARAIENQAFVLGVNRIGNDPHLSYTGGSLMVGPKGEILADAGDRACVLTATIDPGSLRAWRAQFPALQDIRMFDR